MKNNFPCTTEQLRPLGKYQPLYALGKVLQQMYGLTYRERQMVLLRAQVLVDAIGEPKGSPTVERIKSRRREKSR